MSSKWRALQHRHRYTYSSTIFPESFSTTIDQILTNTHNSPSLDKFLSDFKLLISLNTTYSQVAAVKILSFSFAELLKDTTLPPELVFSATRLYVEILFVEDSLPLHRTVISGLVKSRKFISLIDECFVSLCEYHDQCKKERKSFLMSRAALSLMSYPKLTVLNDTMEKCAALIAEDVVEGLKGTSFAIDSGSRPSPTVMEHCQEALSCLYYLLHRFPSRFASEEECSSVFDKVLKVVISILRSSAYSRDCLVAAGVSFWAAIQVFIGPQELACFIAKWFFGFYEDHIEILGVNKLPFEGNLKSDITTLSKLSRLCLLRGMLTAVPRSVLNIHLMGSNRKMSSTILHDGILPELCNYCENPTDSHFNFHVLTVTQICFQQIKTSMLTGFTDRKGEYDPLREDTANRILRIIWNNLEDPLSQTVKQVHLIFDLFLYIRANTLSAEDIHRTKSFMSQIASDLLSLSPRCKGRYIPLAILTKRLGAKTLLSMNHELLFEVTKAYMDDNVCCSVTSFFKCFMESLRDECWSSDGIEMGYENLRGFCLPPILQGLVSGISKLRSNLNTYALPVVLDVDVDSIFPMLAFISIAPDRELNDANHMDIAVDQCVTALVSLLKVSRSLALIEGDIDWDHGSLVQKDQFALVCIKGKNVKVSVDWLRLALSHADESIRIDAAETLFLNPKTASLPSSLELSLMRRAVPLNMRCCSTAFQMKWTSLFRKFYSRVKTALERQVKQRNWQPLTSAQKEEKHKMVSNIEVFQRAEELYSFIKWLSSYLFFSCYPSAPYERKIMAMELILIMIDVWPTGSPPEENVGIYPYDEGFVSSDSAILLVGSIVDSWDRLRESSYHILLCFPRPLPGISSCESVKKVVLWAKNLICSPRVRESDAGALTMRLVFRKYILDLGWFIGASTDICCSEPQSLLLNNNVPMIEYLLSLLDWLTVVVEEGETDLSKACRNSSIHGVLLTLRYTFEELDWNSTVVSSSCSGMKHVLGKLLELIMRITSLALWVVSADAWYLPDDGGDVFDDVDLASEVKDEMIDPANSTEINGDLSDGDVGESDQVVMVGCWLAMKEVSLLLGTIIRKVPLPRDVTTGSSSPNHSVVEVDGGDAPAISDVMFDFSQLENIGNHFLQVLLKMKHNGAIDKTRAGFAALCNRLLSSNDPRLCRMTESWMEQLMERTVAKGQTVDDLLRRSAGIPAAYIAFFISEPEGAPKKLLPWALRWLIDFLNKSILSVSQASSKDDVLRLGDSVENQNHLNEKFETSAAVAPENASKIRDEGLVPTVHAFNVLRAVFNDANLATDTSGFCAEALIISIRSFSSPYWEVRNSACLSYTALVRRMVGFLNMHKREPSRRSLTGLEFFHRYPTLHVFLLNELKIASESLVDANYPGFNMAKAIHPSLCPILILLSRLKPSPLSAGSNDALDPFLFMPSIRRCATQSNLRVRVLASRALTGLISNERLQNVLREIAGCLPHQKRHVTMSISSSYSCEGNGKSNGIVSDTCFTTFNLIHGILLQLTMLLDTNCRNLNDDSKKDEILGRLIQVLMKCSWIGRISSCPCPTLNCSFLQVMSHMLDIARTCRTGNNTVLIRGLLEELSLECFNKSEHQLTTFDPTGVDLCRLATTSYFSCLFEVNSKDQEEFQPYADKNPLVGSVCHLDEKIVHCLSDKRYEVRLAVLKWLIHFLTSSKPGSGCGVFYLWAKTNLESTLSQRLAVEEHWKCICYILRVIFSWNLSQFKESVDADGKKAVTIGTMDFESLFCFWNRLVSLNSSVRHSKTREALLRCMAICVRQFSYFLKSSLFLSQSQVEKEVEENSDGNFQHEKCTKLYGCINSFVLLVMQHSAPSQPVNMRKAAAESIIASNLLREAEFICLHVSNHGIPSEQENVACERKGSYPDRPKAINLYAGTILHIWSTCIQLLEDEDMDTREGLAKDVQSYTSSKNPEQTNCAHAVPVQVEQVIESCFNYLSSIFGHWIEYFDYLSRWAFNTASYVAPHGDLVRQVFDKEIDNHHEEKLLICQICCLHMEEFLKHPRWNSNLQSDKINKSDIVTFIRRWRGKFLDQLLCFANKFTESEGKAGWIGGIGNHKDTFIAIYANLLGLCSLLKCPVEDIYWPGRSLGMDKFVPSDVAKLEESLRPFVRNPLICNLYTLVMKSQGNMVDNMESHIVPESNRQSSLWRDFDPYFLLR